MRVSDRRRYLLVRGVAALVTVSAACSTGDGVDVSHEPEFAAMIGREYRIVGDVDAYGIKNENRDNNASYVTLISPPGISGPEVAFKKRLARGQTFKILSARRQFRVFDNGNEYVVELHDPDLPRDVEVRIALFRGNERSDKDLNPQLYQRLDSN